MKWLLPALMTVLLFSIWAGFALLVVNPLLNADLPAYTIGRICVWEYGALLLAGFISWLLVKKWGNLEIIESDQKFKLVLNANYGVFLLIYVILAASVGIWQFWLFSQRF